MSAFSIYGTDLSVYSFTGFDLPDDLQIVSILSTGTSTHDQVLQQGSMPMPTATLQGRTADPDVIALLRELRRTHLVVDLTEPDEGTHSVVVVNLTVSGATPATFLREWTMTVVEVVAQGSGA